LVWLAAAGFCACSSGTLRSVGDGGGAAISGQDAGGGGGGATDAGATDAGVADAGPTDAGGSDAGASDAGAPDAGVPDAGPADAGTTSCADPNDDWPVYRHDLTGTGRSRDPLPASAAADFALDWAFTDNGHGGYNYANPIVEGDALYLSSGIGYLFALDATNGRTRWFRQAFAKNYTLCSGASGGIKGPIGAPAVVGDVVFMPSGSGSVDAYAKKNGALLWSTQIANPMKNEFIFSSAFPAVGKLFIGIASIFDCNQVVAGRVVALDQATGRVTGTWWGDPSHGPGATVWTTPAYDPSTNRVFITTGTIANGKTKAQQPLAQAFVAIDPDTMQTLDYYSPVTSLFAADLEFGASPLLWDAGGRRFIGAATKGGIFYAMDRDDLSAGPVWQQTIAGYGFEPDKGEGTIVSATLSGDGRTIFVGGGMTLDGFKGGVYAFDAATGAPRWGYHTDGFVLAALSSAGEVVFATATDETTFHGTIYALEASTGRVLFQKGGFKPLFGEVTYAHGRLYVPEIGTVAAGGGRLLAFKPGKLCP
jgi:outer membrane protein assembly factor BamB